MIFPLILNCGVIFLKGSHCPLFKLFRSEPQVKDWSLPFPGHCNQRRKSSNYVKRFYTNSPWNNPFHPLSSTIDYSYLYNHKYLVLWVFFMNCFVNLIWEAQSMMSVSLGSFSSYHLSKTIVARYLPLTIHKVWANYTDSRRGAPCLCNI